MATSTDGNDLINRLKKADANGEPEDVVGVVDELLQSDFERSAKIVVNGANKFLTKGIFCPDYETAFWNSKAPVTHVNAFGRHPVYRWKFWESCFSQKAVPTSFVREAIATCPENLLEAIRQNRGFLNDALWKQLIPILSEADLTPFLKECQILRDARAESIEKLKRFDDLMRKCSPESIVIQFAAWLELKFFKSSDAQRFYLIVDDYFEVLEKALQQSHKLRGGKATPRKQEEIEKDIQRLCTKIDSTGHTPEPDCFPLFEALGQNLDLEYTIELFASHDAGVELKGKSVCPRFKDSRKQKAWNFTKWKFFAFDTFSAWPKSEDDYRQMDKIKKDALNSASAEAIWITHTDKIFLLDYFREAVFETIPNDLGAAVENVALVLNGYKCCMKFQFLDHRLALKAERAGYNMFWLKPDSPVEAMRLLADGRIRAPIEPRQPESYTEMTAKLFEGNESIKAEARKIFDLFSANIHDPNVTVQDKLMLNNGKCDILLPRLWSGDVKTFLFNRIFRSKQFAQIASEIYEQRVSEIFKAAGFQTIAGHELKQDGQIQGEIDIAAIKDSTLFVIEAKMTYFRSRPAQVAQVSKTFSGAARQLRNILELLPAHWTGLAEKLDIKSPLENVRVVPLIVSNCFEYDHLFFDGIPKVSDFEIEMVVMNIPNVNYLLAQWFSHINLSHQEQQGHFEALVKHLSQITESQQQEIDENFSLYPGGREPEVRELIDALENSRFWSLILKEDFGLTPLVPNI